MNIKDLRLKFRLSQQDVADKTGIPRPRLAKWEEGKGNPKAEDSKILANFFASLSEVSTVSEPQPQYRSGIDDLAHSNRLLAESNSKMVDAFIHKLGMLDAIKSNLDVLPGNMKLLTDLLLESQEEAWKQVGSKIDRLNKSGAIGQDEKNKKQAQKG